MSDPKPIISEIEWGDSFPSNPTREVEPSLAKKDLGWISNEKPPYQFFNWFMRRYYLWNRWIDERFCDPNGNTTKTGLKDPDTSPTLPEITLDTGKVGINKLAPTSALDVVGNAFVDGTITSTAKLTVQAGGLEVTAGLLEAKAGVTVTGAALTASNSANVSGGLTINTGGISVTAGGLTVDAGGANITGNSIVTGTLTSTQKLTVNNGGLEVVSGGLEVVSGGISVTAGGLTVSAGGANITGNSIVTGTLNTTAKLTVQAGGLEVTAGLLEAKAGVTVTGAALTAQNAAVINGGLEVQTGSIVLTNTAQNLILNGNTETTGRALFYGKQVVDTASWSPDTLRERNADNNIVAWGRIDGTTTTIQILTDYNVKGIIRVSTGIYTVTFKTPIITVNNQAGAGMGYCLIATACKGVAAASGQLLSVYIVEQTQDGFTIRIQQADNPNSTIDSAFNFMITADLNP